MDNLEARLGRATRNSAKAKRRDNAWKQVTFGFTRTYIPWWGPREGFRETYQNFRDGVLNSSGLNEKDLSIDIRDSGTEYIAEFRDAHRKLLGFIKYSAGKGTVEVANFGASLLPGDLGVGITTKRGATNLAGGHGEGLKMAALTMLREGYSFHIQSSEHNWNFRFDGSDKIKTVCSFSRPKGQVDQGYKEKHRRKFDKESGSEELKAHIWEDVSVKIGGARGNKIDYATFKSWLDVSIDFDPLLSGIPTKFGSLILDEKYQNTIFLKCLRLEASPSIKRFQFGYNLISGRTDRDRHGIMDRREQARTITRIWEEAIAKGDFDVLDKYILMLRSEEGSADVTLVEEFISLDTTYRIWDRLQRDDPEHKKFYYEQGKGDGDAEIIRQCLKKQPESLPRRIWKPLSKLPQVLTPYERQRLLLQRCRPVVVHTTYASGLTRTMKAILFLDIRTEGLVLSFMKGHTAGVSLLLDGLELLIHESWLDFYRPHVGVSCQLTEMSSGKDLNNQPFPCDHVVLEWYRGVVNELLKRAGPKRVELEEVTRSLQAKVSQNLRNMPSSVEVSQGDKPREIKVSWVDRVGSEAFKLHGLDVECRVTLHLNDTCREKREDLLAPESIFDYATQASGNRSQGAAACGCPERVVSQMDEKVTFCSLDAEKEYFPMVASLSPSAFYSYAPEAVRPKDSQSDHRYSYGTYSCSSNASPIHETRLDLVQYDVSRGTYGAISHPEDEMDVDSPQTVPYPQGPRNRIVPIQPITHASSIDITARFDIHDDQFSHESNQAHQRETGQKETQLRAGLRSQSEQMNKVKMRVQALAWKVRTDEQLRSQLVHLGVNHHEPLGNGGGANGPQADFSMEQSNLQSQPNPDGRVSTETRQSRMDVDILNRLSPHTGLDSQFQGCGKQNTQTGFFPNADDERQGYCAQTKKPLISKETLQEQPDTKTADTTLESHRWECVQSEIEALRKRITKLEAENLALLEEVDHLRHITCVLKENNEKLKADRERPNVGLAAELQEILKMISDCQSDAQLPNMSDTAALAEAEDFAHLAGCKRGSLDEVEESRHIVVKRRK